MVFAQCVRQDVTKSIEFFFRELNFHSTIPLFFSTLASIQKTKGCLGKTLVRTHRSLFSFSKRKLTNQLDTLSNYSVISSTTVGCVKIFIDVPKVKNVIYSSLVSFILFIRFVKWPKYMVVILQNWWIELVVQSREDIKFLTFGTSLN